MRLATGALVASLLAFAAWEVVGSTATTDAALKVPASVKWTPRPNSKAAGGDSPASELSKSMDLLSKGKYEVCTVLMRVNGVGTGAIRCSAVATPLTAVVL